jgi:PAS domain S-box-containing protein
MTIKTAVDSAENLRQRAEERFAQIEAITSQPFPPMESERLFHELRVHQIELEMQNEELRRSQAELDTERARYFDLYDLAPSGYLTLSEKGLIQQTNLTAATMLGMSRNYLLKKPMSQFIFPEDRDVYFLHRKLVIEKGEPQGFEIRMVHADGSMFWAHLQVTQADDGEYRITLIDISERKRAEDALKERMKELSCLYGIMNLFNFPCVSFGEILSEVVLLIPSGFQFPEIIEARIVIDGDIYQTPRFRETPWMLTREIIRDDNPIGHLKVCYLEERQREDVEAFLIEERNLLKAIAEKLSLFFEHKQAETELRESDARFNQLAEQSGTVVWETDAKGLLTYISHVSEAVFGYHPDEVIGKMHYYDIHPESGRDAFKEAALAIFRRKGAFINFENRVRAKDGHIVWVSTSGIPILDDSGTLMGYRGSDTDITEKKNTMEQLIQSQKVESIGQLAGGLAHDLNNILTVINGYATLAMHGINQDQDQLGYIKTILEATSRASTLTRSLLAYSRKQEMNQQNQNLNPLIETIGTFIKRIIHDNIEFTLSFQDDPLTVYVDKVQIEQVMLNFATNARDAMPKGGMFSIATAAVSIDEEYISTHVYGKVGDYAVITVNDTGCGMDAETRLKVFDPFFTTKEVGKGTGLGLSMVMGIIKQHGGFIDLQSEPGKGSVFHLYLPLVEAIEVPAAPAEDDLQIERGSGTILIAEDDANTRKAVEEFLTRVGYTVITAVDGQDAVEKFAANKDEIQLVISDVIMPRKNGKEACDEIKLMSGKTKVIYVSGHTYSVIEREGELGADAEVIMKPIMPFELLGRIRELMK